jgi:hypothetical protein
MSNAASLDHETKSLIKFSYIFDIPAAYVGIAVCVTCRTYECFGLKLSSMWSLTASFSGSSYLALANVAV